MTQGVTPTNGSASCILMLVATFIFCTTSRNAVRLKEAPSAPEKSSSRSQPDPPHFPLPLSSCTNKLQADCSSVQTKTICTKLTALQTRFFSNIFALCFFQNNPAREDLGVFQTQFPAAAHCIVSAPGTN